MNNIFLSKHNNQFAKMDELENATPMIKQYLEIRNENKDCIIFFRMGDFYELFFDDAKIISALLGIVLTTRGLYNNKPIEMCGVPVHSYESYLHRIIRQGYKVAIVEQLESIEDAKKRGYKSIVHRGVARIVTSGTLVEDSLIEGGVNNFLVALYMAKNTIAVAYIDISTNEFFIEEVSTNNLNDTLLKIAPKEILVLNGFNTNILFTEFIVNVSIIKDKIFNNTNAQNIIERYFADNKNITTNFSSAEIIACAIILDYLLLTQTKVTKINPPKKYHSKNFMRIDAFTFKSLEILKNFNNENKGSLKNAINETLTNVGSRLLSSYLNNPLIDLKEIENRQNIVDFFIKNENHLNTLRSNLKDMPDLERAISRIILNKYSYKDFYAMRDSLNSIMRIKVSLIPYIKFYDYLSGMLNTIESFNATANELNKALVDVIPQDSKTTFITTAYSPYLKEMTNKLLEAKREIDALRDLYINQLQINGLKISFNNIHGYFVEVPTKHAEVLREHKEFIHKYNVANSTRYETQKLNNLSENIRQTEAGIKEYESSIINNLINKITEEQTAIADTCKIIAILDVLSSFAYLSLNNNLVKPIISNDDKLNIKEGRHIIVEKNLASKANFISNDCTMTKENDVYRNIFVVTGPNMAGKSTYLRQTALIVIMAQIGCFVPAFSAEIGIVSAVFSRVGANDDLFKGQSTFMVEMLELGLILNNADEKSLIILDEIGRGTSTYDGLSIAWATLEYLNNVIKARTLFATHYHELTSLQKTLNKLEYYCATVVEHDGGIVFMHKIEKGYAKKSYGIEVAKIAGLPNFVIKRATVVLESLEASKIENTKSQLIQLPLLELLENTEKETKTEKNEVDYFNKYSLLQHQLNKINTDEITPKEALVILSNIIVQINEN